MPNKILVVCTLHTSKGVLDLLLPLGGLVPGVGTQAVHPLTGHQIEETSLVGLLRGSRRDPDSGSHSSHLAQVDNALAVEVLPAVVVPQLVLDGVQDEPPGFPSLEKCSSLVEISLAGDVTLLLRGSRSEDETLLMSELLAGAELVQLLTVWFPSDSLVLRAGLGHQVPALLMTVQPAVLR